MELFAQLVRILDEQLLVYTTRTYFKMTVLHKVKNIIYLMENPE